VAQYLTLAHASTTPQLMVTSTVAVLAAAAEAGLLPREDASALSDAFALFQSLLAVLRLSTGDRFEPDKAPGRLLQALVRAAVLAVPGQIPASGFADLERGLVASQTAVRQIFDRLCSPAAPTTKEA
jgi:glutamine synthetase adenylyltransferase